MRTDGDGADFSVTPDDERCAASDIVRIDAECMMNSVRARHLAGFVEQHRERILVLVDVLLAFEQAVNFLRRNEDDAGASFGEFIVRGLKLSHLAGAVRSPGAANEYNDQRFAAVVG